jgi:hypothetical protein
VDDRAGDGDQEVTEGRAGAGLGGAPLRPLGLDGHRTSLLDDRLVG